MSLERKVKCLTMSALYHQAALKKMGVTVENFNKSLVSKRAYQLLQEAEVCYHARDYAQTEKKLREASDQNVNIEAKNKAEARLRDLDHEKNRETIKAHLLEGQKKDTGNADSHLIRVAKQNRWIYEQVTASCALADKYFEAKDEKKAKEFYEIAARLKDISNLKNLLSDKEDSLDAVRNSYCYAYERLGYLAYKAGEKLKALSYYYNIDKHIHDEKFPCDRHVHARILCQLGVYVL